LELSAKADRSNRVDVGDVNASELPEAVFGSVGFGTTQACANSGETNTQMGTLSA